MLSRTIVLPLAALIGAALVDGAFAAGAGFLGSGWTVWPIVGGLAALVIVALTAQVQAARAEDAPEADAYFALVDGQTALVSAALVVIGLALLFAACAPDIAAQSEGARAFVGWAGFVTATMGFVLAAAKSAIGTRKNACASPLPPGIRPQDERAMPYSGI